jgi:hypothetical protein
MLVNHPAVVAELQTLYLLYEAALVTNDVETLTNIFWNSPLTTRFGVTENLHGYDKIATFRQNRPPKNLQRTIRRIDIVAFGPDHGQITVEFERSANGRTVSGRQSQSWVRFDEGWRIVSAHVSLL